MMKNKIPYSLIKGYRKCKRFFSRLGKLSVDPEKVFTDIYTNGKWAPEGEEGFCSGGGTIDTRISEAYLEMMKEESASQDFKNVKLVDLGCGDMRVGSKLLDFFGSYTGVDVVKPLIESHQKNYSSPHINFDHLDIVKDDLPAGDICCVREVFQHLSNEQIGLVLPKLKKYKIVYITEHLPSPNTELKKNKDKPTGHDIRLFENSGIFLTEPPFNLPSSQVTKVLEVEGHKNPYYKEEWVTGRITTFKYVTHAE